MEQPDKISIVFATRNRPENLRRFYQSVRETAHEIPEICVYIDNDDCISLPVVKELGFKHIMGPRHRLSECYNEIFTTATQNIIMYGGDDVVFRVKDWDLMVLDAFSKYEDKITLVFGDDGYWGDRNATHGFLHRNWINAVGYFIPPYFAVSFVDNWLTELAGRLDRKSYIPIVLAEHMHPSFGKAIVDAVYTEGQKIGVKEVHLWERNIKLFLKEDLEKLRVACKG